MNDVEEEEEEEEEEEAYAARRKRWRIGEDEAVVEARSGVGLHQLPAHLLGEIYDREIVLTHLPLDPATRDQLLAGALHDMDTALWQRYCRRRV
jgi:hypothetical protein